MKHLYTINNADCHAVAIELTLTKAKETKERLESEDSIKGYSITKFSSYTGNAYWYDGKIN